ncbi:unnamed protein product [Rotaria socialis]|uniref:UDENN domain-containing protein n=1 Tax=Rotaria socialis TaxID=392032 RepID=A0A817N0W5_9BILA|nr:unnamed protein product [Rotaria socialis]CAF3592069.1 unnamed protein product [Rotaria socialis]CAF3655250.1 unnamed protein product [Rotaria socialis]
MASGSVTKEIESRIKQSPEHLFEVFLEIHQPINNEPPAILIQYPDDFSDQILKTAANFVYPCRISLDDQSEYFTFVVLDSTSLIFRFGYCRRSNREPTRLCIISYYPWFETFCNILNDLSQIINTKSPAEVEAFLLSLYNYKVTSIEDFYKNDGKEMIEINNNSQLYSYSRPDQRKLPSMLSNSNFTIMLSRLGPDLILRLFAHLIFERRILFISSKLFHLTACACGCLHLINPMHWQSIFLPILPESMTWTAQCTAPYIIGMHSSIYSKMNKNDLGDVIIVNIDDRTIRSQYDDLSLFPKHLIRSMKKDIQQSSEHSEDHLARIFLRAMVFIFGNYSSGFVIKNDTLDFDRGVYLKQYHRSELQTFMTSIVNTQMFEQFSRYRTYVEHQHDDHLDEFDIELKRFEQIHQLKKPNVNKQVYKNLENTNHSRIDPTKTEKVQTIINKSDDNVVNPSLSTITNVTSSNVASNHQTVQQSSSSTVLLHSSNSKFDSDGTYLLIDFNTDKNSSSLLPTESNVNKKIVVSEIAHISPKINSKMNDSQNELQTFDPTNDESNEINELIQQFDPLNHSIEVNKTPSTDIARLTPSIYPSISLSEANESNLIDLA